MGTYLHPSPTIATYGGYRYLRCLRLRIAIAFAFSPRSTGGGVGVAGARTGAEHPGLAGGGGRRHPGEENDIFCGK